MSIFGEWTDSLKGTGKEGLTRFGKWVLAGLKEVGVDLTGLQTGKGSTKATDSGEIEKLREELEELKEKVDGHDKDIEGINEALDELEEKGKGKVTVDKPTKVIPAIIQPKGKKKEKDKKANAVDDGSMEVPD